MQIHSVDLYADLYQVSDLIPADLEQQILSTPWLDLDFTAQQGQENWRRRRVVNKQLPWFGEFHQALQSNHAMIEAVTKQKFDAYMDTAFWVDLPGFICPLHTDGELPASMQIFWAGEPDTGTGFYHSKNKNAGLFIIRFSSTFYHAFRVQYFSFAESRK